MSKASKFADMIKRAKACRPRDCDPREGVTLYVDSDGRLFIRVGGTERVLDAAQAMTIAHWIIDTFGEPEGGGREGDGT